MGERETMVNRSMGLGWREDLGREEDVWAMTD